MASKITSNSTNKAFFLQSIDMFLDSTGRHCDGFSNGFSCNRRIVLYQLKYSVYGFVTTFLTTCQYKTVGECPVYSSACYMSSCSIPFSVNTCGTYSRHLFTNVSDSSLLVSHFTLFVPFSLQSSKKESEMWVCSFIRSNK